MSDRLLIEELAADWVRVGFCRSGQTFVEAEAEAQFVSPLSEAEREDLRWYLKDYLIAPYAVYEERGQAVQAKLKAWGEALFEPPRVCRRPVGLSRYAATAVFSSLA